MIRTSQVRRWDSWHRHATLALAALTVLAICAADAATDGADDPTDTKLIKLTVNEVRRLINTFIIQPIRDLAHRLRWSQWRHQVDIQHMLAVEQSRQQLRLPGAAFDPAAGPGRSPAASARPH
ncbi:hypothetical protein AB0I37_13500 [Micromonospora purpureochromogenes]|uniref:hypothetical protein n=1 Tax=Micromonospora purpureochromogenes TaxID=47872 RepID=UPI0034040800